MFPNQKTYKLNTDDVNHVNRFIAGINRQDLNGEAVVVLSNERMKVEALLLGPNNDSQKADIDATDGVRLTGRQLRDLLEDKLSGGITIATKSGDIVRVYQTVAEEARNNVGQVLGSPSSIPPPPISAVA